MECENCGQYISEWAPDWSICWRCKEDQAREEEGEDLEPLEEGE